MFVNIFVCLPIFSHYRKLKETRNKINDISALDVLHGKTCSFPAKPQLFTEIYEILKKLLQVFHHYIYNYPKHMKNNSSLLFFQNFPWGDGKHTLFFNEEALPLPGKGYIREEELHVPILITIRNLFNMKARWTTKVGDPPSHGWTPIPGVDDHHH